MTDPPPPPPGDYPPSPPPGGAYPPAPPPQGAGSPPAAPYASPPPGAALPKEAYTPWLTRVLAWLIDSIPIFILLGIGYVVAFGTANNQCVGSDSGYGVYCTSSFSTIGVLLLGLAYIASIAYAIWNYGFRQGTTGSSIGKSIMKFKVVSEKTGQPIGFGLSIVRQLAHIIDGAICYIGYLFPLWDAKRQTIADKIMTTVCLPL